MLTVDELVGSLEAHEQRKKKKKEETLEQALQIKATIKDEKVLYTQNFRGRGSSSGGRGNGRGGQGSSHEGYNKAEAIGMLRLHIVEVNPEQEPPLLEEEDEKPVESELTKGDESGSLSSLGGSVLDVADDEIDKIEKEASKEKPGAGEDPECKELEMDDWLFEFSQLFRSHVGIDPDAHIDLHELGMELCLEALEAVTSEEAQVLFDKAAAKFQEVAVLFFFNWGNVYMCAARKRIPLDESAGTDVVAKQLQIAYDWVKDKYSLAREKYEEALAIKPDFYEGLLALGQQQFEMAKLHWSFALAKKIDLSTCDSTEMLKLFNSSEEKMKVATDMWEKLEEQRAKELEDPTSNKKEEMLKRKKKQGSNHEGAKPDAAELSADEATEQTAVMRSQINDAELSAVQEKLVVSKSQCADLEQRLSDKEALIIK